MASVYSLQQQCSFVIWKNVGVHRLKRLDELPLPNGLQQYVLQNHNLQEYVSKAVIIRQTEHVELRKGYDTSLSRPIVYAIVSMENPLFVRFSSLLHQWDRLHHPGIVQCYHKSEDIRSNRCLFVLDDFPITTLEEWLDGRLHNKHKIMRIFLRVTEAVQYLHYRGIYNSRLTPGSIVVSEEGRAVILLLNLVENEYKWFHPPHYPHSEKRNEKADVWRLGLILYQLLFKRSEPPVKLDKTLSALAVSMIHKKVDLSVTNHYISSCMARVLKQCLNVNPTRRPTLTEVISFLHGLPRTRTKHENVKRYQRPASAPAAIDRTSFPMGESVSKRPESATALRRHLTEHINCSMTASGQETHNEEVVGDLEHKEQATSRPLIKNKLIVWPNSASFLRVSAFHCIPRLPSITTQKEIQ